MSGFRCASEAQTSWLRQHGPNNLKPGTAAKVYVVTESANPHDVVAFFAWCMSATASETLPARLRQGVGGYPIQPFLLLARFGVHSDHEGHGIGSLMLRHVIVETYNYSKKIGCRGLLIHAEGSAAVGFYRTRVPEFVNVHGNEHHLLLLAKDIGKNLDGDTPT